MFQSRAGFSECLDRTRGPTSTTTQSFNPVLGFLSVSTDRPDSDGPPLRGFNPVLGFLSVSTAKDLLETGEDYVFQSRAGFSECLDPRVPPTDLPPRGFNPVLGFLSVSTFGSGWF